MQAQPDEEEGGGEQEEDLNNYKGIYFNDDPSTKYQDPLTGAHFDYSDMC